MNAKNHYRYVGSSNEDYNRKKVKEVLGCIIMVIMFFLMIFIMSWLSYFFVES